MKGDLVPFLFVEKTKPEKKLYKKYINEQI
jgi:hypothetical protein